MSTNPYPYGQASVEAYRRAHRGRNRYDLFATERDTVLWQVQAFDNDGRLWRPGDELPTVAGTGISRYGLSRLAAFQDVGVELPPDYQISVGRTNPNSLDFGALATVHEGRLAEVDVPRDNDLPWLYYYGWLAKAGNRPELEGRIRDQTERLDRARAAYRDGLTGTVGPYRKPKRHEYEEAKEFLHQQLQQVDWSKKKLPGNVHLCDYLYSELTPERQREIVEECFNIGARDKTGFTGMTREQIHEHLLRHNDVWVGH
jgi:hypothetical protein